MVYGILSCSTPPALLFASKLPLSGFQPYRALKGVAALRRKEKNGATSHG